jgi:hypothetical protein
MATHILAPVCGCVESFFCQQQVRAHAWRGMPWVGSLLSVCPLQSAPVAMLSRSSSWPVVRRAPTDPCVVPLLAAPKAPSPVRKPPPILDPRKTATLSRHYYPEGGWGWVVVGCSVGVHVLNHGLQLGGGAMLLSAAAATFHTSALNAGTWLV